jgi:integrase
MPLSIQALNLLKELHVISGNYHFAFPGRNDPNKPISEGSINRLIQRVGYGGRVTGHGFRHTISTILHDLNFDSFWLEAQLAQPYQGSL